MRQHTWVCEPLETYGVCGFELGETIDCNRFENVWDGPYDFVQAVNTF